MSKLIPSYVFLTLVVALFAQFVAMRFELFSLRRAVHQTLESELVASKHILELQGLVHTCQLAILQDRAGSVWVPSTNPWSFWSNAPVLIFTNADGWATNYLAPNVDTNFDIGPPPHRKFPKAELSTEL